MRNYENGSRHADKFVVRLPAGLREKVEAAAGAGDTSMNTVVITAIRNHIEVGQRQALLLDALEQATKRHPDFDVDEHASMALDAKRYRFLRDELLRHDLPITIPTGASLDKLADDALRTYTALNLQTDSQEAKPCVSLS